MTVSTRSPCGSKRASPLPAIISLLTILDMKVDLPVPVFQTIYTCLALSSLLIPSSTFSAL